MENPMRKYLIAFFCIACTTFPLTASAADDMAAHKQEIIKSNKQETVALGGNRFLIFSGSQGAYQYAYSLDLVKIDGGVPHFEPLFIEEYDPTTNSVALSDGVGFGAESYRFDTKTDTLSYTSRDVGDGPKLAFKYQLNGDTLTLQEVLTQEQNGMPETLYKK
jgi:hypothetical protein